MDALASAVQVESPIELSQSPVFEREYPSVYDVLGHSKLDHEAQRELVCKWSVADAQTISGYEVYAADSTGNPHPEAECLPARILLKTDKNTPALAGQEYVAIVRMLHEKRSWVAPLDMQRVSSDSTASAVTAQQVLQVHQHSPQTLKVITADSRYANKIFLAVFVSILTLCVLVRLRSNMALYGPPPKPNPHKPGRHRKHGDKFKLKSALRRTHSDRDETIQILWHPALQASTLVILVRPAYRPLGRYLPYVSLALHH